MFDGCPHPATNAASPSERTTLFIFGVMRLLSHLYVNLLDYIPHKATAVPLFLALSVSHCICRASHQSKLPAVSRCPGRPPASPGVLPNLRIQSSICPARSSVCRHLHSSNPVTGVESDALNFNPHSGMQHFIRV